MVKKDVDRLDTKKNWICVRSSDKGWILCHQKNRPLDSVTISDDKTVKIVDPISCEKEVTIANRVHWTCKFK